MLDGQLDVLMIVTVEPDADIRATEEAVRKAGEQGFTVALTPFISDGLLEAADLLLPVGTSAESSGTFVNIAGTWQSFPGIAAAVWESRPTWKVLRVIGNLLDVPGFDYVTSEDVLAEFKAELGEVDSGAYEASGTHAKANGTDSPADEIDTPLYSVDGLTRRANALQKTLSAKRVAGEG